MLPHTPLQICLSLCRGYSEACSLLHLCPLGRDVRLTADFRAVCQDHSYLPKLFLSSILSPQGKSKWHALSSAHPPPALNCLITRVSPPPSGDLEGGEAKVQVK